VTWRPTARWRATEDRKTPTAGKRSGRGYDPAIAASGPRRLALAVLAVALLAPAGTALAAWQPTVTLSAPGVDAQSPSVAVSAGGAAVAVWSPYAGLLQGVQAASRPPGGPWGPPETLVSSAPPPDFEGPARVAIDTAGNAVAVWGGVTGFVGGLRAASRPAGGVWSPPETLAPTAAQSAVASDSAGNALGAWIGGDGIKVADRPAGGAWQEPETLPYTVNAVASDLDIAVAPSGAAVAVWSLQTVSFSPPASFPAGVEAAVRPAGGAWSAPQRLSEAGFGPAAAVDGAGNAVVVWREAGVRAATRPAGGAWSAPQTLSTDGGDADVAVDGDGNAVAVWNQYFYTVDESTGAVVSRGIIDSATRPAGGAWSAPVAVSDPAASVGAPRVAVNGAGDAVATWIGGELPMPPVVASVRPAGGRWGPTQVLSEAGGPIYDTDVGIDQAGNAVVVWERPESGIQTNFRVQAAVYEAEPPAPAPGPATGTPRCLSPPAPPTASPAPGRVALSADQLRINQRIGQAAIRRLNAVEAWLDAGIQGRDICGEAIGAAKLAPGITTALAPAVSDTAPPPSLPAPVLPDPRPLDVAPAGTGGGPVRLSVEQLLINQRISQAAIRRAAALERRLAGRLTGGDLAPRTIAQGQLALRLQVVRADAPATEPAASRTEIAPPSSGGKALSLSAAQLRINQRIAQAAVRRANALVAHLQAGLDGDEFADGSITARALAAGVVGP